MLCRTDGLALSEQSLIRSLEPPRQGVIWVLGNVSWKLIACQRLRSSTIYDVNPGWANTWDVVRRLHSIQRITRMVILPTSTAVVWTPATLDSMILVADILRTAMMLCSLHSLG